MIETYLVQRLAPPPETEFAARAEQAFGGGNLMLSAEAWKVLQQVFSLEYMGAAEYEFGTIPKCLKALAADGEKLRAFSFTVEAKDIEPNWQRGRAARTKAGKIRKKQPAQKPVQDRKVFVLCREEHVEGAKKSIMELAKGKTRTKCSSCFPQMLDPVEDTGMWTCGWLELDNGFFFFTDKTMWERTTALFTGKEPNG